MPKLPAALSPLAACLAIALGPAAVATPVDDLRNAQDVDLDVLGMTYSYSGFASGAGVILDEDAPPTCVAKEAGTLDIMLDLEALGAPLPIVVTATGAPVGDSQVVWTVNVDPNQCVTVDVDGVLLDLLVRQVTGQLTVDLAEIPATGGFSCGIVRSVGVGDTDNDAESFLNIVTYALCTQLSFLRIDFQVRGVNILGLAGRGCFGDTDGDLLVNFADLNTVLDQFNQTGPGLDGDLDGDLDVDFADLNLVLGAFNQPC